MRAESGGLRVLLQPFQVGLVRLLALAALPPQVEAWNAVRLGFLAGHTKALLFPGFNPLLDIFWTWSAHRSALALRDGCGIVSLALILHPIGGERVEISTHFVPITLASRDRDQLRPGKPGTTAPQES